MDSTNEFTYLVFHNRKHSFLKKKGAFSVSADKNPHRANDQTYSPTSLSFPASSNPSDSCKRTLTLFEASITPIIVW